MNQNLMARGRAAVAAVAAVLAQPVVPYLLVAQDGGVVGRVSIWGWVAAVAAVAALAIAVVAWRRSRAARDAVSHTPPLVFPAALAAQPRRTRRVASPLGGGSAAAAPAQVAKPLVVAGVAAAQPAPVAVQGHVAAMSLATVPPNGGTLVEGHTLRFHQPVDSTLQMLPGRLEVIEGADSGHCIRFVRTAGAPEITFGRSEGPPYRHIQLRAPTVSRQHAQLRYDGAGWSIANLSQTNPVVVNGEELRFGAELLPLHDGDRIEMGELAFVYRER